MVNFCCFFLGENATEAGHSKDLEAGRNQQTSLPTRRSQVRPTFNSCPTRINERLSLLADLR